MKTIVSIFLSLVSTVFIGGGLAFGQSDQAKGTTQTEPSRVGAYTNGDRSHPQNTLVLASLSQPQRHRSSGTLALGVRHRVPQDYATIQGAIDASTDGDTILVSEGKYPENIRFRGKAITVASLYIIDGDTAHIEKTIIDGSSSIQADSGSVVSFVNGEDTTSVLCGLTIQGGTGTRCLHHILGIWMRAGGGVFCDAGASCLRRNIITRNRVMGALAVGGGIAAWGSPTSPLTTPCLILDSNRITDNYVRSDGSSGWWGYSGGAEVAQNQKVRIVGNLFERDSVFGVLGAQGVGITYATSVSPQPPLSEGCIAGNIFRSNIVSGPQGAIGAGLIALWTGDVLIQHNVFEANSAISLSGYAEGGGVLVDDHGLTGYGRKMILKSNLDNFSAQRACRWL